MPIQGTGTGLGLRNTYTNDNATAIQGQRRFQVVRVPQYDSATVLARSPPKPGTAAQAVSS